eukprot:Skav228257  [mRNA]  locus=scaffold3031:45067:46376:+ [translate_table: standard]
MRLTFCSPFSVDVQGYELVGSSPLGSGGFGVVHCCRCQLDRRLVAVKTVYQPFVENEATLGSSLRMVMAWEAKRGRMLYSHIVSLCAKHKPMADAVHNEAMTVYHNHQQQQQKGQDVVVICGDDEDVTGSLSCSCDPKKLMVALSPVHALIHTDPFSCRFHLMTAEEHLRRELENLAALPPHPNLLRCWACMGYYTSFLDDRGILHIVTEFLESVKLFKLIRESKEVPQPTENVRRQSKDSWLRMANDG